MLNIVKNCGVVSKLPRTTLYCKINTNLPLETHAPKPWIFL